MQLGLRALQCRNPLRAGVLERSLMQGADTDNSVTYEIESALGGRGCEIGSDAVGLDECSEAVEDGKRAFEVTAACGAG